MDTSELRQHILRIVAAIPHGKVASYGQIATFCGYPSYARYVGTVLRNLPKDTMLPWYRVINSRGEIAFPINSKAYIRQLTLLSEEGVNLENGKISMRIYGWSV